MGPSMQWGLQLFGVIQGGKVESGRQVSANGSQFTVHGSQFTGSGAQL
jgi:hypothetical protein